MTEITTWPVENQGTLALRGDQADWTPAQRAALDQIGVGDAPTGDQQVFLHVAQRTGLDPFARQIYMISRWDPQAGKNKWTIQTGIDGYRVIAERRPQYGGQLGPQWCGDDGEWRDVWTSDKPPAASRVGVIRKDWEHPAWGVAHFWEFAATKKDGTLTHMWASKGRHQISKCAEAAALRKAFSQDFAGVYTDDEMDHLNNPVQRVVIDAEEPGGAPEPDWDALIAAHELRGDLTKLGVLWHEAKRLRPNDTDLKHRIEQAAKRIPAVVRDGEVVKPAPPPGITENQSKRLHAMLTEHGINRETKLALLTSLTGREITTSAELTEAEATNVTNWITGKAKEPIPLIETVIELIDRPAGDPR